MLDHFQNKAEGGKKRISQGTCPLSKELSTSDILAGGLSRLPSICSSHTQAKDNLFLLQFIMLRKAALREALFPEQVDLSSSFAGES